MHTENVVTNILHRIFTVKLVNYPTRATSGNMAGSPRQGRHQHWIRSTEHPLQACRFALLLLLRSSSFTFAVEVSCSNGSCGTAVVGVASGGDGGGGVDSLSQAYSYVVSLTTTATASAAGQLEASARNAITGKAEFKGDASAVLNSCVQALPHSGGTIFLRAGEYTLSDTIIVNRSSVEIRGERNCRTLSSISLLFLASLLFWRVPT
jgi:hypothetical protein